MINLAYRDIANGFGRYLLTSFGLGLLIGATLTMAGVYRGMVDDAKALINGSATDIWVVQRHTLGPYAESSTLHDDAWRGIVGLPGVAEVGNVAYLTMQVNYRNKDVRVMIAGFESGKPGEPMRLVAGRPVTRSHYEAVADVKTGFQVGDKVRIRRHEYTVVGLTSRMVSSGGDPMLFISLRDAQEVQFLKDNDAIVGDRERLAANPQLNRPGVPGFLSAVEADRFSNHNVNAVLVRVAPGADVRLVADSIVRWKHLQAYTRADMEQILVAKLIATSAKQIGLFLVILTVVSTAIVALTVFTMTMGKIKEIAVLKLIGAKNRVIVAMILQQALGLGVIGFVIGKTVATFWAPIFPKYVLLEMGDAGRAFAITMVICTLASIVAIRAALKVSPATAIGGG